MFDNGKYTEINAGMSSGDPLKFTDSAPYVDRIKVAQNKTGLTDAVRTAHGKINGIPLGVACMDFAFIGGSFDDFKIGWCKNDGSGFFAYANGQNFG